MDWRAKYINDGIAFACEIGNRALLAKLLPLAKDRVQVQPSLNILALQANFHLYNIYKLHGFRAEDLLLSMSMTVRSDLDFFHLFLDDLFDEWPKFDIVIYKKLLSLTHRRNCMDGSRLIFSNILRQGSLSTIFVGLCDIAARRSDVVILDVLANLECQFHNKWTILIDAVRRGHPDVVEFIIRRNQESLPDFFDDSPIDIAFKFGSRRILDILLSAAPLQCWGAVYPEDYPCHFKALLGIYHEPLSQDKDSCGRSVLHCACLSGNLELIDILIRTGIYSVSVQDNTGMSLVHVAALLQRKDILELLLSQKPSLRLFTILNEWSPLHFACNNGDYEMVKMLLEAGASQFVKCKDRFDCSPMDLACCKEGSLPIIKLLEQYGGDLKRPGKSLFSALNCNDMEIAEFLFPNISTFTEKVMGMTIVERACHIGNMDFLRRFLHRLGDFWSDHRGLLYACYAGNWSVAQYLIKTNKACLNDPGPFGEFPFLSCLINDYRCPNVLKTLDFLLMSGVLLHEFMLKNPAFNHNLLRLYRENYFMFLKFCEFAQSQIQIPHSFIMQHVKGKNDHCYECLRYMDYDLPGEIRNVTSLLSLTRLVVRRRLIENGPINELVTELPIPMDCQDFLVFKGRHELGIL